MNHRIRLLSAYKVSPTVWAIVFALWREDHPERTDVCTGVVSSHASVPLRSVTYADTGHESDYLVPSPLLPTYATEASTISLSSDRSTVENLTTIGSHLSGLLHRIP